MKRSPRVIRSQPAANTRLHRAMLVSALTVCATLLGSCGLRTHSPNYTRSRFASIHVDSAVVAVNGTHIFYEAAGMGSVVVLIHGGNLDHRLWDAQFLPLAREHRVISYDARGFGKSGTADSAFQAQQDLRALLDALHVEHASLVGLSMGARVAIDFALEHPAMVERLVLASPGLSGWQFIGKDTAWVAEALAARDAGNFAGVALAWLKSDFMRPAMQHADLVPKLQTIASGNSAYWQGLLTHGDLEAVPASPALHRTAELHVPTLLLVGARDTPDIQHIADTLSATVRGLKRVTFKGAGHMVNMEQPQRFTSLVRDFLRP